MVALLIATLLQSCRACVDTCQHPACLWYLELQSAVVQPVSHPCKTATAPRAASHHPGQSITCGITTLWQAELCPLQVNEAAAGAAVLFHSVDSLSFKRCPALGDLSLSRLASASCDNLQARACFIVIIIIIIICYWHHLYHCSLSRPQARCAPGVCGFLTSTVHDSELLCSEYAACVEHAQFLPGEDTSCCFQLQGAGKISNSFHL